MLLIAFEHLMTFVLWAGILGLFLIFITGMLNPEKRDKSKPLLKIVNLTEDYLETQFEFLRAQGDLSEKSSFKFEVKKEGGKLYVLDFFGSVYADEVEIFRNEITSLISVATPEKDEILIRIESPGGSVNGYGLVASQIKRLKNYGLKVTISVDQMACSGGYLAAVVGDSIIAAPFSYIGSIGVVSEFLNFSSLLNKYGVSAKEYTAGDSKRLISQYREITQLQEDEYKAELESTHHAFIEHVKEHRDKVQESKVVFTGKSWLANEAINLGLVDKIQTSDEFIHEFILNPSNGYAYQIFTKLPKDPTKVIDRFIRATVKAFARAKTR